MNKDLKIKCAKKPLLFIFFTIMHLNLFLAYGSLISVFFFLLSLFLCHFLPCLLFFSSSTAFSLWIFTLLYLPLFFSLSSLVRSSIPLFLCLKLHSVSPGAFSLHHHHLHLHLRSPLCPKFPLSPCPHSAGSRSATTT